jgi:hypothetical protein
MRLSTCLAVCDLSWLPNQLVVRKWRGQTHMINHAGHAGRICRCVQYVLFVKGSLIGTHWLCQLVVGWYSAVC